MRLELSPRLSQGIKCRACDGFMHSHEANCPQEKLALFCQEASLREHRCPKCPGSVALNRADFYECRKCRTQFSTGPACGEDETTLERSFLMGEEEAIRVLVMTSKGRGEFRDDEILKMLRQGVKEAVAQRRATRRACRRSPSSRGSKESG